jgi:solute carrier family 8 (sodium/calcium exchanger)
MADKGMFDRKGSSEEVETLPLQEAIPDDVTQDELAMIEQQIRELYGAELTPEQVIQIMQNKYFTTRSRAYYRRAAMQTTIGGKKKPTIKAAGPPELQIQEAVETSDNLAREKRDRDVVIGFVSARYAFLEDCGHAVLEVSRSGPLHCKATVNFKTRDGTATKEQDYDVQEGTIVFDKEESMKTIQIKINDDNAYEENEEFYVDLSDPAVEGTASCQAVLSDIPSVIVVIIDDDHPGTLRFKEETMVVIEQTEGCMAEIVVERVGGASGTVSCQYATENMNGIAGMDYEGVTGKLDLGPAVQSAIVQVPIKQKGRFQNDASFILRLSEPNGCEFDK